MSGITGDIKKLFNFKYKSRNDGVTDQYNRLFMVKAMLVGAFLTGLSWYKDDVKCIIPKHFDTSSMGSYGPKACWINGFYVYDELRQRQEWNGYFGLPIDLSDDGHRINSRGELETCHTKPTPGKSPPSEDCKKMHKKFFLQYQWFPFYLAILAFLYYIPYICYKFANTDLISLKKDIKSQDPKLDDIVKNYFTTGESGNLNLRILYNLLIKLGYLIVNVCVFVFTNGTLNGEFQSYGTRWNKWAELNNSAAHTYMGRRSVQRPGERLLPVFGFCDILELGKDVKHELINEYRLVCELSQHVLYHYVLIALWWLIIVGMILSIVGVLAFFIKYAIRTSLFANEESAARRVYNTLSPREGEYLDFIRKKNVQVYGELIRKLHSEKFDHAEPSMSERSDSQM